MEYKYPKRFYKLSTPVYMPDGEVRRVQKNAHNDVAYWCFTPEGADKPKKVRGMVFTIPGQDLPEFRFTYQQHLKEYLETTPVNNTYVDGSADAVALRRMIRACQHTITFE